MVGTTVLTVGVSQPLNEKVMNERFAALNASVTSGAEFLPLFYSHQKGRLARSEIIARKNYPGKDGHIGNYPTVRSRIEIWVITVKSSLDRHIQKQKNGALQI